MTEKAAPAVVPKYHLLLDAARRARQKTGEAWARPQTVRVAIGLVALAFLALYAATFTHWYTFDSISYALHIRRFEQTGEVDWLFHPHHLLFNGCGWVVHQVLRGFDPDVSTLAALQGFTALLGAAGLAAFAAWLYEETGSGWVAVTAAVLLGGSFGWWFASTDGRANVAATALLLAVVYLQRRAARECSTRGYGVAGMVLGVACLIHQSHLLFLPVALLGGWGSWRERVSQTLLFWAGFALLAGVPYLGVLFVVKRFRTFADAVYWVTTYGQQGTWWSFSLGQNLFADLQALYKSGTGKELTHLGNGRLDGGGVWGVGAACVWLGLGAAALPGIARGAWRRRRAFVAAPLGALVIYSAFFTVWNPGYFVFWFAQTVFLIALLAVGWHGGIYRRSVKLALSVVAATLVGITYVGSIAPKHALPNPHLALAARVQRIADPQGLVVLSGMGGAAEAEVYVPYFARMQALALHTVWAEAGGDTEEATRATRALIDRVLRRGNRVYLLSEATHDPGSLRAMDRRYGVTPAQLREIFAPYDRQKVDRNGYIVIFRLLPRMPAREEAVRKSRAV